MAFITPSFLKRIPGLRFLIALIAGILFQYHLNISLNFIVPILFILGFCFLVFQLLSLSNKFFAKPIEGVIIIAAFFCVGALLSYHKNQANDASSFLNQYDSKSLVLVKLEEDIVVKPKSFKALASVVAICKNENWIPINGKVLLYFKKDSVAPTISYGSHLVISKKLLPIVNSGNPGGYNYARFCSFQDIYHQIFLSNDDYSIQTFTSKNWFKNFINNLKHWVLNVLNQNIYGKNELSIAEALLIGFRDNLDKDLVKAYSNTGVVHIIAISGLHLGMIYGLLLFLCSPFPKTRLASIVKAIFIVLILWLFSCMAGLAPSILRSAIMFSCIAIGECFSKKSNIYNSLAVSAFIIIVINPFSLWDVGFQLSYSAVLSIILFSSHIKRWFYFQNKILAWFWNLNAITLSAQILTLPFVLYHFHQFPIFILLTNIIAVPLSGFILYTQIFLMAFAWFKPIAKIAGKVVEVCLAWLNRFIINIDSLPIGVIPSIQISILQAAIMTVGLLFISLAFVYKKKSYFLISIACFVVFFGIRSIDFIQRNHQEKLIVYNVPNRTAIDLIEGRNYLFIGDEDLIEEGFLQNFHLKPSRILHRISEVDSLNIFTIENQIIYYKNKRILIVYEPISGINSLIKVDVCVFTKNPTIYLTDFTKFIESKMYVFDGSNPMWKIEKWKKDCDNLHLQYHITALQGAFEMNFASP